MAWAVSACFVAIEVIGIVWILRKTNRVREIFAYWRSGKWL